MASDEAACLAAKHYLGTIEHRAEKAGFSVLSVVTDGSVGESIVAAAAAHQISHIVMSTHGCTGLMRWTLGRVTNTVLDLASQPLLLLRPYPDRFSDLFPLPDIRRIVVALDGSVLAETSLTHVRKLARVYEAEIRLFQAVTAELPALVGAVPEAAVDREAYLERVANTLRGEGLRVGYDLGLAPPAEAIQHYAEQTQADLIAMATHVHRDGGGHILGSITNQVVRLGQVPVLVTRQPLEK
jgi:nucleotide-binding universal stress UspA family protein